MSDTPAGWVEARDLERELVAEQPQLVGLPAEYRRSAAELERDALIKLLRAAQSGTTDEDTRELAKSLLAKVEGK